MKKISYKDLKNTLKINLGKPLGELGDLMFVEGNICGHEQRGGVSYSVEGKRGSAVLTREQAKELYLFLGRCVFKWNKEGEAGAENLLNELKEGYPDSAEFFEGEEYSLWDYFEVVECPKESDSCEHEGCGDGYCVKCHEFFPQIPKRPKHKPVDWHKEKRDGS